jgi:PIN domain nuclease of toxin-antitoxin system
MSNSVLDASALLTYLLKEPGQDEVLRVILSETMMSTVNFAEVASRLARNDWPEADIRTLRQRLMFPLIDLDDDVAIRAGVLEKFTRPYGLSLGERVCLALAQQQDASAVTADRKWDTVGRQIGVSVTLIR